MAASTTWPRLDPAQQKLLLNALSSNKRKQESFFESEKRSGYEGGPMNTSIANINQVVADGLDPSLFSSALVPASDGPGIGSKPIGNAQLPDFENPLDFDLGLGASGVGQPNEFFGFDTQELEGETGEKRKSPDDGDDDDEDANEDEDPRRRGSEDGPSKKPGRKPLTTEPTTKRKAQNRAAQRAFRERKERHVKDLELKVMDLEKASESANHENGMLRAQVERLQDQIRGYKRRISVESSNNGLSPSRSSSLQTFPGSLPDFEFDFPKFGAAPRAQVPANQVIQSTGVSNDRQTQSPASLDRDSSNDTGSPAVNGSSLPSLQSLNGHSEQSMPSSANRKASTAGNGMFGNGFFNGMPPSSFVCPHKDPSVNISSSTNNYQDQGNHRSPAGSGSMSSASPAASHNGPSSSCCTSPDPIDSWLSEGVSKKPNGDSQSASGSTPGLTNAKTPNSDMTNIDWLAAQNEGQFDPILFGDYRDTQDAIVGDDAFTSGFFDDSFGLPDLNDSFFNTTTDTTIPARVAETPKPNLMQQVARQRDGEVEPPKDAQDLPHPPNLMTCHKIWNQLQDCPKFKSGDFDVDSLCAELSSKAKCTETGVGVPKDAVEAALWKLAGKDAVASQAASQQK